MPALPTTTSPAAPVPSSSGFSFDDFDSPTPAAAPVKVTGDDDIEKFESEFPDIDIPVSSCLVGDKGCRTYVSRTEYCYPNILSKFALNSSIRPLPVVALSTRSLCALVISSSNDAPNLTTFFWLCLRPYTPTISLSLNADYSSGNPRGGARSHQVSFFSLGNLTHLYNQSFHPENGAENRRKRFLPVTKLLKGAAMTISQRQRRLSMISMRITPRRRKGISGRTSVFPYIPIKEIADPPLLKGMKKLIMFSPSPNHSPLARLGSVSAI